MRHGGRLIYIGAGTSGRLGVWIASECPPTFGTHPELVVGLIAGGPAALTEAVEGAEDDREGGAAEIAELAVNENDSVIGIAASGHTPYAMGGLQEAKKRGALTVSMLAIVPPPWKSWQRLELRYFMVLDDSMVDTVKGPPKWCSHDFYSGDD